MRPIRFPGYDVVLGAPDGWDEAIDGPCEGLPIIRFGDRVCTSVWTLTWKERLRVLLGWNIQLSVIGGRTQPPVTLAVTDAKELGKNQ